MKEQWTHIESQEDYPKEEVSVLLCMDGGPELEESDRYWQMVGFWIYSGFFNKPVWFDDRGMEIEEGTPFAWKGLGKPTRPRIYSIEI